MRYLSHYTEAKQTELFEKMGAFFAFSNSQFNAKRKEGVEYVSITSGLIVPKANAAELVAGLKDITKQGIAQDLAENGREGVIKRELNNHECFYTGSIEDCVEALEQYGIGADEIKAVYSKMLSSGEVDF